MALERLLNTRNTFALTLQLDKRNNTSTYYSEHYTKQRYAVVIFCTTWTGETMEAERKEKVILETWVGEVSRTDTFLTLSHHRISRTSLYLLRAVNFQP